MSHDGSFAVVMVCTGNIGRSPMMERILRHQLRQVGLDDLDLDDPVSVASAGTWAVSGQEMEPFAAEVLAERGIDASGFRATPLTEQAVGSADLVLTATREHRSRAVNLAPAAVRRSFTVLELERIVRAIGAVPHATTSGTTLADRARAAVAWASQMRGSVPRPASASDDDVPDPLGKPIEFYRARADEVTGALEQIVPFLLGLRDGTTPG